MWQLVLPDNQITRRVGHLFDCVTGYVHEPIRIAGGIDDRRLFHALTPQPAAAASSLAINLARRLCGL